MRLSVFLKYLSASVLSMVAVRFANMADAILIGNIIGANGLAGVTLCQPVMQVIFSLYTLLVMSSAIVMGTAIGKEDKEKASRLLSFGMKAGMAIGVGICLAGNIFFDDLSHILCKSDELRPYTNAYLHVILFGAIPQMGMYALNQFVTVDGSPQMVSRIAIGGNILNVCLDVVFMKYFGWGIAGAALATLTMYVVCTLLLLRHKFVGAYGIWQSLTRCRAITQYKGEVFHYGLPLFISTALLTVQFNSNNTIVTTYLGIDAMVVLAVCMQLYDLSLIILTGALGTVQPLGARLKGEGNTQGLRKLYVYTYIFLALAAFVYCGSIALMPTSIAMMLGAVSIQQQIIAAEALPPFAAYLALMPMAYLLLPLYQFYNRKLLTYIHAFGVTLVPPLCFAIYAMSDTHYCWWGLAIGETIVITTLLLLTYRKL